jgi:Zn-finger nucleic acid-binding protein
MHEPVRSSHPFRHATAPCPRCRKEALDPGRLQRCGTCDGAWLPEDVLADHVGRMQHALPHLAWHADERPALPCPRCRAGMEPLALFDIPVDRCRGHGVWFDAGELAEVLERSARAERPSDAAAAEAELARAKAADPRLAAMLEASADATGELVVEGAIHVVLGALGALLD